MLPCTQTEKGFIYIELRLSKICMLKTHNTNLAFR